MDLKTYAKGFHVPVKRPDIEAERAAKESDKESRKRAYVPTPTEPKKGYVYYARDGHGRIKIGQSLNPWSRVKEMRCHNPTIEVMATEKCDDCYALEHQRHEQFKDDHLALEWFKESEAILSHINNLKNLPVPVLANATVVGTSDGVNREMSEARESTENCDRMSKGSSMADSRGGQTSTIEALRELVANVSTEPEPVKLTIFRNDFGAIISEGQWKKLEKLKLKAKEGGYVLDEYSQ